MKSGLTFALMCGAAATLSAQQPTRIVAPVTVDARTALESEMQAAVASGGRARAAFEARVTRGAPYSAEAVTEFTQTLADGNRISRKSVTRTFRDSDGRTRREQAATTADGEVVSISIVDPVSRTSFVLDPKTRTAIRGGVGVMAPALAPSGSGGGGRGGGRGGAVGGGEAGAAGGGTVTLTTDAERQRAEAERNARVDQTQNSVTAAGVYKMNAERTASGEGRAATESLGQQLIEGVLAEGTRTTTVIPAGGIGNDQPITIVSEQWFSPDLQVLVMTRHSDPRTGETVYRLSNIVRGEPDRSLFELPPDYTVKENRLIRQRQPGVPQ